MGPSTTNSVKKYNPVNSSFNAKMGFEKSFLHICFGILAARLNRVLSFSNLYSVIVQLMLYFQIGCDENVRLIAKRSSSYILLISIAVLNPIAVLFDL